MGFFSKQDKTPAQTVVEDVLKVRKNETALIVANPGTNVIAQELFTALVELGARPVLVFQGKKTALDPAEPAVIGALKSEPAVIVSVSEGKLGTDSAATATPYMADGQPYDHIFDYLLDGKKTARAVWAPGLTQEMFSRTVKIDYRQLAERCKKICARYEKAVRVHVTSPNGTDVLVPVQGRRPLADNGDFSQPGSGGNIPAGEVFISPVVGSGNRAVLELAQKGAAVKAAVDDAASKAPEAAVAAESAVSTMAAKLMELMTGKPAADPAKAAPAPAAEDTPEPQAADTAAPQTDAAPVQQEPLAPQGTSGTIVFDGSMSFSDGDALLETPITVTVQDGFVTDVRGGKEAQRLLKDITAAERESLAQEAGGRLAAGQGAVYCRNARNIGELGIGLNPAANITGNMLEDEKAFRTCHFAIGRNYDGDAPSLIHFDGVVRNPTVTIQYEDGKEFVLLDKGDLQV